MRDDCKLRHSRSARAILFSALFSVIEVLVALYLKRHIQIKYMHLFPVVDLLLYLWIVYLGFGWTIGYRNIFVHGIWFFKEKAVILTAKARKSFFYLYIPHVICSIILFCWFLFSSFPVLAVFPAGKIALILVAYKKLFIEPE